MGYQPRPFASPRPAAPPPQNPRSVEVKCAYCDAMHARERCPNCGAPRSVVIQASGPAQRDGMGFRLPPAPPIPSGGQKMHR